MAPHSSTFAQKIPWTEEPGRLQFMGSLESDTTERLHFHFSLSCTGEGNSNPFQCSCLENPRDGVVWWAAVYVVAQSRTRLKQCSSSRLKPWSTSGQEFLDQEIKLFDSQYPYLGASLVAQWQRICLPMQEMLVQSLGWEDPVEKKMATHFSSLAWEIPWTEEPGGLQSMSLQKCPI